MKLRDVECPEPGCCDRTQHHKAIAQSFEVGREVPTFRHAAEAAPLVRRSVRHPEATRALGRAARRRVLAEHFRAGRVAELARAS